jgi:small-conductance mechanosensitive channel
LRVTNGLLQNSNLAMPDVDIDVAATYAETLLWFQHHWLRIVIAAGIAAAIIIVLYVIRAIAIRYCERDRPGKGDWWLVIGLAISRTLRSFIILAALRMVLGIARPPEVVTHVIRGLFTIAAVFQGAIWARALILGAFDLRTGGKPYAGETLSSAMGIIRVLVNFAVFAIALIVVLDNLGINVTGLVAGLGVGGIAIGLAAQGIFADLFAALAIILDRPFRVGDTISYGDTTGRVEAIGLKSTRLRAPTGEELIIANKQLLEKEIHNNTLRDYRRIRFTLGIIHQTTPEAAQRIPGILQSIVEASGASFVRAGFVNFSPSSLDFELEFDCPANFEDAFLMRHAIGLDIAQAFADQGIRFAYPTQTSFTAAPDGTMVLPYAAAGPAG